jgi:3-oxoadipate enol-lactonase
MTSSVMPELDLRYLDHRPVSLPDGTELYHELRGQGPMLTLINNFYMVSPVWRSFTSRLAETTRVLTYDLRNQGASTSPVWDAPFEAHVDDLGQLLDALEIEQTYLLGSSISTLICREFAVRYPDRVKGLILVGPAFSPLGPRRRKMIGQSWLNSLKSGGAEQLFEHLYPLVFSDRMVHEGGSETYLGLREAFIALNSPEQLQYSLETSLEIDDDPDKLRAIRRPTLVLIGDGDFQWSQATLDTTVEMMPDARAVTLPNAGHVPFFDNVDGFETVVAQFVAECEQRV